MIDAPHKKNKREKNESDGMYLFYCFYIHFIFFCISFFIIACCFQKWIEILIQIYVYKPFYISIIYLSTRKESNHEVEEEVEDDEEEDNKEEEELEIGETTK